MSRLPVSVNTRSRSPSVRTRINPKAVRRNPKNGRAGTLPGFGWALGVTQPAIYPAACSARSASSAALLRSPANSIRTFPNLRRSTTEYPLIVWEALREPGSKSRWASGLPSLGSARKASPDNEAG
jgi:hypothetical protein